MVSGRVVDMHRKRPSSPSTGYLSSQSLPALVTYSISSSETAVCNTQSQLTSRAPRYTRPSFHRRTKATRTARERLGSKVNAVRDQSQLVPKRLNWSRIVLPCCSFQSQISFRKASRPMSSRVSLRSAKIFFSTTAWVAMPAWSVPGTHSVSKPDMRRCRATMSCKVPFSAWPMCSTPVTLGGGIMMV